MTLTNVFQTRSHLNLALELAHNAQACSKGPRHWLYIELDGTLDDLADSDWRDRAPVAEVSYKIERADVLRALCDQFDAAAGIDVSIPLDDRLRAFRAPYLFGRAN